MRKAHISCVLCSEKQAVLYINLILQSVLSDPTWSVLIINHHYTTQCVRRGFLIGINNQHIMITSFLFTTARDCHVSPSCTLLSISWDFWTLSLTTASMRHAVLVTNWIIATSTTTSCKVSVRCNLIHIIYA